MAFAPPFAFAPGQGYRAVILNRADAKDATDEKPIEIEGAMVGTIAKPAEEPRKDALRIAWEGWQRLAGTIPMEHAPIVDGFLSMLHVGATGLKGIAKRLYKRDRSAQLELMEQMFESVLKRDFGVHPHETPTQLNTVDQAFADATAYLVDGIES